MIKSQSKIQRLTHAGASVSMKDTSALFFLAVQVVGRSRPGKPP
jgi:hypothetical protein